MDTSTPDKFIEELLKAVEDGCGVVPLVGAGFSAPSGVPLVWEIEEYLHWCICLAFGLARNCDQPWNPGTDQWPSFDEPSRAKGSGFWKKRALLAILNHPHTEPWQVEFGKSIDEHPGNDLRLTNELDLWRLAEAWGTMSEWRAALQFLARAGRNGREPLTCGGFRQEHVDAVLRKILGGKAPSLPQRMLASLTTVLKIDLILTTNFDNLIESAFKESNKTLEVFDVQLHDPLPDINAFNDTRALVKLHGSRVGLRADFSTDAPVPEEDLKRFEGYMDGRLLLVIGYSAKDLRINQLINRAYKKNREVFFIGYRADEVKDFRKKHTSAKALHHTQVGLLLLQLYQAARLTLPSLGTVFPSPSIVSVPPPPADNNGSTLTVSSLPKGLYAVMATEQQVGVTSLLSKMYADLEIKNHCIWLDMNDLSGADMLFDTILEAIHYKLGVEDWICSAGLATVDQRISELHRLMALGMKSWVIFLNAREIPGLNTINYRSGGNGWLDELEGQSALKFLKGLTEDTEGKHPFTVSVLMGCFDTKEVKDYLQENGSQLLNSNRANAFRVFGPGSSGILNKLRPKELHCTAVENGAWLREFIEWTEEMPEQKTERLIFLAGLAYMQRPRLPSAIFALDGGTMADKKAWVAQLTELKSVRVKTGGLIWIHSSTREELRAWIEGKNNDLPRLKFSELATVHGKLASWYEKVVDASDSPSAVFEAVYHLLEAVKWYLKDDMRTKAQTHFAAATSVLTANRGLVKTHGYSSIIVGRATQVLSQAEALDKGALKDNVKQFKQSVYETLREVTKEIGEDDRADEYHRNFAGVVTGEEDAQSFRDQSALSGLVDVTVWEGEEESKLPVNAKVFDPVFLRWQRWSALLAVASRSYECADAVLSSGMNTEVYCADVGGEGSIRGPLGPLRKWGDRAEKISFNARPLRNVASACRLQVLLMIETRVEGLLLRQSAIVRASLKHDQSVNGEECPGDGLDCGLAQEHLSFAAHFIERGRLLARNLRDRDRSDTQHETMVANWAEARLLMHQAVIESRDGGRFAWRRGLGTPMGFLEDAEALLKKCDPKRRDSEFAILELHRAEVLIREAESKSSLYISKMFAIDRQPDEPLEKPDRSHVIVAARLALDAIRHIDRADSILKARRRSVWWTTWYLERRMRAIAIIVGVEMLSEEPVFPWLGWQATPLGTETELDRLLGAAQRVIRFDSYRLATVIHCYLVCLLAIQGQSGLESRVSDMKAKLKIALRKLNDVDAARAARGASRSLDESVAQYVSGVIDLGKKVL